MDVTTSSTTVTIVTLGRLGVEGAEPEVAQRVLAQPKRMAVLVYTLLSQRGGTLSRDQLMGVFWPESSAERARNSLRQTLSFLRGSLGENSIISIGQNGLAAPSMACDAGRFESLLDSNRREEALRVYGGDFLPGLYVEGSSAFTEWVEARRHHFSHRAAKAAWDLSADCEGRKDSRAAAFWGKRALALSPFSESEVQRLLRLLERIGDFAGALRAYQGLQVALRSEFGAQPSAETTRLADQIRKRVESEGLHIPSLLGTRRSGTDRRMQRRRALALPWRGRERRLLADRRARERRSGVDRRAARAG
jgi:DNA-binding SARP family transcriptional activator